MNEYNYYADFYLVRAIQNTFVSHISIISKILFNMIIELGKKIVYLDLMLFSIVFNVRKPH
jgi:hypothetical protein